MGHTFYSQVHGSMNNSLDYHTSPLFQCTVQTHSDRFTLRSSLDPTTIGCLHCEDVLLTSGHHPSWTCVAVCTTTYSLKCVNIPTQVIWTRDVDKVSSNCFTHAQWWLIPCDVELLSWNEECHRWSSWSSWGAWEHRGCVGNKARFAYVSAM